MLALVTYPDCPRLSRSCGTPDTRKLPECADVRQREGSFAPWPNPDGLRMRLVTTFFNQHLKGRAPEIEGDTFTAFTQTCPAGESAACPFQARSRGELHVATIRFGADAAQTVVGLTGDRLAGAQVGPVVSGGIRETVQPTNPAHLLG